MTPFRHVITSHNRLEWWYDHLAAVLTPERVVTTYPVARFGLPGFPPEADIVRITAAPAAGNCLYLGSPNHLFRGVAEMPMPTCVWADFVAPLNLSLLPCLQVFDVVFSSQKSALATFKDAGIRQAEWLPFAFDATVRNDPEAEKIYDVGFVGSLDQPATRVARRAILGLLERKYRLNDYRTPVYGGDLIRVYNRSRIVVNIPVPGGSNNMRTFEALGSGALLLTPEAGNAQEELFQDGVHLVTYRDQADLMAKTEHYLRHEEARAAIARAGHQEVLARHTYRHRAARMLEVMATASRARRQDRAAQAAAYAEFYSHLGRADLLAGLALAPGVPAALRLRLAARAGWKFWRQVAAERRK